MKQKVIGVLGIIILVVVIAAFVGGGDSKEESKTGRDSQEAPSTETTTGKEFRFAGRPDSQEKDIELLLDESAELEGLQFTLTDVQRVTSLGEFEETDEGEEFVTISVSLENVSDRTEAYNTFNFRIQTAGGQVLDGALTIAEGSSTLNSGDLVPGGKVSGTVTFEVPKETGHQYIIYKPNAFKSDRIIVKVQ